MSPCLNTAVEHQRAAVALKALRLNSADKLFVSFPNADEIFIKRAASIPVSAACICTETAAEPRC